MYGVNWKGMLDIVSATKADSIDKEQIKNILIYDRTYTDVELDSLYMRGVLTFDEYKYFMGKFVERLEDRIEHVKEYIVEMNEKGDKYDPFTHYGFGMRSFGSVIDSAISESWNNKK